MSQILTWQPWDYVPQRSRPENATAINIINRKRYWKLTKMPSFHPKDMATSGSTSTLSTPSPTWETLAAAFSPDHPKYAVFGCLEEEGNDGDNNGDKWRMRDWGLFIPSGVSYWLASRKKILTACCCTSWA